MSIPNVVVQIGFDTDASVSVVDTTWTDVSKWVAELSGGQGELVQTRRGKQYELDEFEAGTLQLVLDNRDGRFSPDNTVSPYWPNVKPMRRVRVLADGYLDTYSDTYGEPVFSGFVDQWPQQWLSHAAVQVSVAASDGFKVLHNFGLPDSVWAHAVSEDSPTHWWRLAETEGTTALDIGEGNTQEGTYSGGYTLGESGLVEHDSNDSGVLLDGTGKLTIPAAALPTSDKCSIEIVVRIDALPATLTTLLTTGPKPGSDVPMMSIMVDDNGDVHVHSDRTDATGTANNQSGAGLVAGGTYHIMVGFTESAQSAGVYVDGAAAFTVGSGSTDGATSGDIEVGASVSHNSFQGIVSEVAFYDGVNFLQDDTASITAHASAVDTPWNGDTSGERVGRTLDLVAWPTSDRDLDIGATTFQDASFVDDGTALAFVQRAAMSEYGYFFVSPDSDAKFIGRHNLLTEDRYVTSQGTFSDQPTGTELPYADLQLDPSSDATVVNDWTVQRKFGPSQSVSDPVSISAYFERSQSRTALMMDNDAEAHAQAEWLLAHTKDPVTRIRRLTLDPAGNDDLWGHVLGRELMDRVTVNYRIPGGGSTSKEVHIIGIEHRISKGRWLTDWWLSPADTQSYLILDDATFGTLDENRLGY